MNKIGKISGMLASFLLTGSLAFAQEITVKEEILYRNTNVSWACFEDGSAAEMLKDGNISVGSLAPEQLVKKSPGSIVRWDSSNIGYPLYFAVSDVGLYEGSFNDEPCPAERKKAIAEVFLQNGADPNGGLYHQKGNNTDKFQKGKNVFFLIDTPLGYAARTGNLQTAEMLLRAGADPNYSWEGYWERTGSGSVSWDQDLSHFALEQVVGRATYPVNQRVKMIHLLAHYRADVNAVTRCGMTPLALVVARTGNLFSGYGHLPFAEAKQMAQALLDAGANTKVKGGNNCSKHRGSMTVKEVMKELPEWERDQWDAFFKSNRRK